MCPNHTDGLDDPPQRPQSHLLRHIFGPMCVLHPSSRCIATSESKFYYYFDALKDSLCTYFYYQRSRTYFFNDIALINSPLGHLTLQLEFQCFPSISILERGDLVLTPKRIRSFFFQYMWFGNERIYFDIENSERGKLKTSLDSKWK